jgi:hypothetical protein
MIIGSAGDADSDFMPPRDVKSASPTGFRGSPARPARNHQSPSKSIYTATARIAYLPTETGEIEQWSWPTLNKTDKVDWSFCRPLRVVLEAGWTGPQIIRKVTGMHFSVMVFGDNVEQQLAPYQETNMGPIAPEYMEKIDHTD